MATATVNGLSKAQIPGVSPIERRAGTHSPYGLPIIDNCVGCKLCNDAFFCSLSEAAVRDLDNVKHMSCFPEGSMLFLEGQDARGVYVLCQGRAKLSVTNPNGKSMILRIARPGAMLGLNACISGKPYDLTAETLQPAQLVFIRRNDFLRFLNQHPDACLRAAEHLAQDCQSAYQVIRSVGLSHSVSGKLARLLLQWSSESGVVDGSLRLKVALTHEEMAQLIGASRETVTRALSEFKKQQVLEVSGSTLLIRNKPALEVIAS